MLSSIPDQLTPALTKSLEEHTGKETTITNFTHASGGCISNGGRLQTSSGTFFLKWNSATKYPRMFEAEKKGLELLGKQGVIHVPQVVSCKTVEGQSFIVMEYIESGGRKSGYWETLGRQLAALHKIHASSFGLDHDNYIGSLPQHNGFESDWTEFFTLNRIEKQLKMAVDGNAVSPEIIKRFDTLFAKLNEHFPVEKPSLIHGDLWSGNLMVDEKGDPCIFDPAVYFGHREMELAFTKLFGGFDARFYDIYMEKFPLEPGIESRIDIYNLYPLLVHVNLFGGGYINQVNQILKRFT